MDTISLIDNNDHITLGNTTPTVNVISDPNEIISIFNGIASGKPGTDGFGVSFITTTPQIIILDSVAVVPQTSSADLMFRALSEQINVTTSTDFTDTNKWRSVGVPANHDHDDSDGYVRTVAVQGTDLAEDSNLRVNVTRDALGLGTIATRAATDFLEVSHGNNDDIHITSAERTKWNTGSDRAGTALQTEVNNVVSGESAYVDNIKSKGDTALQAELNNVVAGNSTYVDGIATTANNAIVTEVNDVQATQSAYVDAIKVVADDALSTETNDVESGDSTYVDSIKTIADAALKQADVTIDGNNLDIGNVTFSPSFLEDSDVSSTGNTLNIGTKTFTPDFLEQSDVSVSGNTLTIGTQAFTPTGGGSGGSGEANVNADWTESDPSSDAFIENKEHSGIIDIPGVDSVLYHSGVQFDDEADVTTTLIVNSPIDNTTEKVHITMYVISTNMADINTTTFTVTWGGVSRTFTLNLGYFSGELTFTGLTNPSNSSLTISKNIGGSLGANIKVVLDHTGTVAVTPATKSYLVDNYITWGDYKSGLYDSDYTETNGSTTIKLQFGGTNNYVYRNIIDTPYSDVIYSEAALTTELTRRGA